MSALFDVDSIVNFMAETDQREKMLKLFHGSATVLSTISGNPVHGNLVKSIGDGRALVRFGQQSKQTQSIRDAIVKNGCKGAAVQLSIVRWLFEISYLYHNNCMLLGKWGLLQAVDQAKIAFRSSWSLIVAFTAACIVDLLKLAALDAKQLPGGAVEYNRKWRSLTLEFISHFCDLTANVSNSGSFLAFKFADRTVGLITAFSAIVGIINVWPDIVEKTHAKKK